jgi:hypothetical protein
VTAVITLKSNASNTPSITAGSGGSIFNKNITNASATKIVIVVNANNRRGDA